MYEEVNTGTNLPAQIDLYATDGDEYKFLFIAKGGGSRQQDLCSIRRPRPCSIPDTLKKFLVEKMKYLGTAACPPYHIAFVIGGTSAEACLKTVKLASAKYLDDLPTSGNEHGQAFRDLELEKETAGSRPQARHRRPVRRQVLRPRRPRHPPAPPRRLLPGRHGRFLLGRPQHQGQDHQGRPVRSRRWTRNPGRLIPAKYRDKQRATA